jgi:hypothetical protein
MKKSSATTSHAPLSNFDSGFGIPDGLTDITFELKF